MARKALFYNAHCGKARFECCQYPAEIPQLAFSSLGPFCGHIAGDSVAKESQESRIAALCSGLWLENIGFRY